MNIKQVEYLKAMDIPLWLSKSSEFVAKLNDAKYYCFVLDEEYQDAKHLELLNRILGALNWPQHDIKIISYPSQADNIDIAGKLCVAFGVQISLESEKLIQVSSLTQMMHNQQAKKSTWLQLKKHSLK